ncbi:hypothetical protein R1sor_019064 [Riccia sorocarpa]|uniref:IFT81 calponin homology domain-containing protein n=1 Tax=Riccia sorocarpa TaxID=122646 RepID=A0ABD3IBM3_9MARC
MEEAEAVVAMLNSAPFNLNISAVEFCQKSPWELSELLFSVLSTINPAQNFENTTESTNVWMMETLAMLSYQPNADGLSERTLQEGIATGNPEIICSLLAWLLPQVDMLQKRVYLVRFLSDVEIPPELVLDETTSKLQAQNAALREQFKVTHQQLETLRQMEGDPVKVKEQVVELETEREHLRSRISELKNKLQDVEKLDEVVETVKILKSEMIEEKKLAQLVSQQRQELARTSDKHEKAYSMLQQIRAEVEYSDLSASLNRMLQETCTVRLEATQKLPEEIETKEVRLHALQKVLSSANNSEGLANIQAKLSAVNEELKVLRRKNGLDKLSETQEDSRKESMLSQQTHMGSIVANNARVANDNVAALRERRDKLQTDLDNRNATINEVKATIPRGEELKNYVDALRAKSVKYKEMKKEIADLDSEHGALLRNLELLEQQTDVQAELSKDNADHVSKHTSAKNLRKMTEEVKTLIQDIRRKLTPQVKELKLLRADLQGLELEQTEKKQQYSDIFLLFERKVSKLEAELASSRKEYEDGKQTLKDNASAIEKLQASQLQIQAEKETGSVSSDLSSKIEQQQELLQSVQCKQQKIKETEHFNSSQMAMMKDLLALLAAKLSLYSSSAKPSVFSTATSLERGDGAQ